MRALLISFGILFCCAFATAAKAQAPCCSVTAMNAATGVVSAKVNANGAAFQFRLTNANLLKEVRVGTGVYANFTTHQVSLDGKTIAGPITSEPQAPAPARAPVPEPRAAAPLAAPAVPPSAPTAPARAPAAAPAALAPAGAVSAPAAAPRVAPAPAPVPAAPAPGLAVRAPVAAASPVRQPITQLPVITLAAAVPERTPASSTFNPNRPRVEARTLTATVNGKSTSAHITHIHGLDGVEQAQGLPDGVKELLLMHVKTLGAGESADYMINTDLAAEWAKTHPVSAAVKKVAQDTDSHTGCKSFSMHCAGEAEEHAEGQASGVLKQAQDDWGHAATQLGHDWDVAADQIQACFADTRTNPVELNGDFSLSLPSLITLDSNNVNAVLDAVDTVNKINAGTYQPSAGSAGSASSIMSSGAIAGAQLGAGSGDGTQSVAGFTTPGVLQGAAAGAQAAQPGAAAANAKGSPWSDSFKGKIAFGFPQLTSRGTVVHADFFYIPCLPFMVRPRSIGVSGSLGVEAAITGNAQVNGNYTPKTIALPTADLHYPIQTWMIPGPDGVPIAELDLSLFVQGFLQITAKGQLTTNLNLVYSHSTSFDFTCDGKGCQQNKGPQDQLTKFPTAPAPTTATAVTGSITVQPKLFTGLELNLDVNAIQVRAGPEATLEGDVQGGACLSTNGAVHTTSDALLSELGWTPSMHADVVMFTTPVGNTYDKPLEPEQIMAFQDLLQGHGGSSALTPTVSPAVSGKAGLKSGESAIYNVKMPGCYPYSDPVTYHVAWTGGALTAGTKACTVPPSPASGPPPSELNCVFDPKQSLALSFAWPQASTSDYTITVALVRDTLGRNFASADPKPAVVPVSVAAK